jgi:hypothetical protein
MVNLNNIFNKFYPKSQTSPMGKKLIIMAWIIEITVALVGFSIAASFIILGNQEIATATGTASKFNFEFIIIGLAFFVVGIMELTKIPIATALYYAAKSFWKVVFFLALLAVNFSTFETIIQGFELAFNQRSENNKLESFLTSEKELTLSMRDLKWHQKSAKEATEEQIEIIREKIINSNSKIDRLRVELDQVLGASESKNIPQLEKIRKNAELRKNQIQKQINDIVENQLTPKQNEKSRIAQKQGSLNEEIILLQEKIDQKSKEVDDVAGDNQIYRLAVKIKVLLSNDSTAEFSESDLDQTDIDRAFWIWFGFLAFVISVIGTFVALAGLHLMDERMHEIRNQPLNRKNTLRYRFGRLFVSLSKYFSTQIKVMIKPKTIEKIIEKEIEVEKIIEKPIYQDRIVHVDREVPKETIVKEMVYVPLPTDDAELLKKGPFKANEFNEKSKKK